MTKITKYYIEFIHDNSESENYDMQTKWFDTAIEAKSWLFDAFDFIDKSVKVFLMTAEFDTQGDYDIVKSELIEH